MIFAIGDLHLSFSTNKPMDIFGHQWENHYEKIKEHWLKNVREGDLVLLPGDFSWAMTLAEVKTDMDFINQLPGIKLLVKGNHDYWWQSITQLKKNCGSNKIHFLQNDCFIYEQINICGTRGWLCPNSKGYTKEDEKIYLREVERLKLSLLKADNRLPTLVMMHFPPINDNLEPSGFTDLFKEFGVKHVVYGHIHGADNFKLAPNGLIGGVHYQLVSADFLDFNLSAIDMIERDFDDFTN
jgi:hypothetical protein